MAVDTAGEYDEVLRIVGLRLKEARQKAGLTQSQLGAKANLKQSYIFELETGGSNITLKTLAKMADVLGMDARDLLPESRLAAPSTPALELLQGLFHRVALVLVERESQDAKRQLQNAELACEIRAFTDLRFSLEQVLKTDHDRTPSAPLIEGGVRSRGSRKPSH